MLWLWSRLILHSDRTAQLVGRGSCVRVGLLLGSSQAGMGRLRGAVSSPSSVVFKTPRRKTAFGI